jgi:hypothetical protein
MPGDVIEEAIDRFLLTGGNFMCALGARGLWEAL